MRTGLVIPSIGARHLGSCLEAVAALDPAPDLGVLVLSDGAAAPSSAGSFEIHHERRRLGFAAAVNAGIAALDQAVDAVAILNDDATPDRAWLGALIAVLEQDPEVAAVQGTVVDGRTGLIDGRGIGFDRWGLPVQIDRGRVMDVDRGKRQITAISATAGVYRVDALRETALTQSEFFDPRFDSYHEDVDLGLRMGRLGYRAVWIGGAQAVHLGSASGRSLRWRHPRWVLVNRWRAISGNLSHAAFLRALPRTLRGELRAVRTLSRDNWRALPVWIASVVMLPLVVAAGWRRRTPGPRLDALPEVLA